MLREFLHPWGSLCNRCFKRSFFSACLDLGKAG